MIRKILVLILTIGFSAAGLCRADGWEANLNAGTTSVYGGLHYKKDLNNGYLKSGISGLYTDDDNTEYKWAEAKITVGSENVSSGLNLEAGFAGIFGDAEDQGFSGDVGAVAFTGYACYLFPRRVMPVPLEVFGGLTYAPEVLAFRDTETYLSYRLGIGARVVSNASVFVEYQHYDVDMEAGPGSWNLDDDVVRLGLTMRF